MRFAQAIDAFVLDMRSQGRFTSDASERSDRSILARHSEDVLNRDPRYIGREDVKRTLRRWSNPNSQSNARSILVSFHDWAMEEGYRKDNPARQTRRPKRRPTDVYRLTRDEARAMLDASLGDARERRAVHLGICAGLRNAELRGLQGRHFRRDRFVWVSADIAKGGRERWMPAFTDLEPVVAEIRGHVPDDCSVLPAQRFRDVPYNRQRMDLAKRPSSSQALRTLVMGVAKRAGISAHIHPHLLRHAFGDHVARYAGMRNAQFLLGHSTVGTTEDLRRTTLARRTRRCRSRVLIPYTCSTPRRIARFARRGDDRNRTGVNGFAGRCVTTPPRRRASMRVPVASSTLRALAATVCIAVTVAAVLVAIVAWQAMDTLDRANRAVDDVSAAARRVDTRTRDLQPTVRELRDAARALSEARGTVP